MKELDNMVQELKNYLDSKDLELKKDPNFNAHTQGHLQNRRRDIENFQLSYENCDFDPFLKNQIIDNFKNEANRIKLEIDKISIQ